MEAGRCWTVLVPKVVSHSYVAAVASSTHDQLMIWTFSVKGCTGGGLPTTGS